MFAHRRCGSGDNIDIGRHHVLFLHRARRVLAHHQLADPFCVKRVVYKDLAAEIGVGQWGTAPALVNPLGDGQGVGVGASAAAVGRDEDRVAGLGDIKGRTETRQRRPRLGIANLRAEQARRDLGVAEAEALRHRLGKFGVGLVENRVGEVVRLFAQIRE